MYAVPRGSQRGKNLYEITKITRIASDYWITSGLPGEFQDCGKIIGITKDYKLDYQDYKWILWITRDYNWIISVSTTPY